MKWMNKLALKTFATNARRELLKKVEARAMKIGITEDNIKKADIESSDAIFIDGRQLSKEEKVQRDRLIDRIRHIGFKQVMEEVAYTWFNRFTALRFMEVNDYLPTKVRVLSSTNAGSTEPDMMKEALSLDLELDKEYIYELKMNNNSEELFKYLIIKHCNDLNRYMPFMFETIDDYTEILFPDGLLAIDSFVRHIINTETIPEDNWREIEVIGWLYQYYISEEKDQVFTNLKDNIKVTKDTLPAATQLFTPNWIVRYMVENSLGQIWLENYPESHLRTEWRYYLDNEKQEESVIKKLDEIRYENVNPEEITFLDPCCGSGHILVYAFDVFYDMYLEKGYVENEIPQLIIEKNLYGLDVDNRAAQLASFAIMMKAREKSRRIFRKSIQPNILAIQESNWLTDEIIANISGNDNQIKDILSKIRSTFLDAKEFGSLVHIEPFEHKALENRLREYSEESVDLLGMIDREKVEENLPLLLKQSLILSHKYDVVCTNPPYMGISNMGNALKKFVQKNYKDSKADLYATFIEWGLLHTKKNGYCSLITMHSWFFLSSYEALRKKLLEKVTLKSILHLGMEAFEGIIGKVVQTAAFIIQNNHIGQYKPTGIRLVDFYDSRKYEKENQFFNPVNKYNTISQNDFGKIPGSPIVYWISNGFINAFETGEPFKDEGNPKVGMQTSNNDKFLRMWYEVKYNEFQNGSKKWIKYIKGGSYRKWYGNLDYVVWYNRDPSFIQQQKNARVLPESVLTQIKCSWTDLATNKFSCRDVPMDTFHDISGHCFYPEADNKNWLLGFSNTKVFQSLINMINSSLHYQVGDVGKVPVIYNIEKKSEVDNLVNECVSISKNEWDSVEKSWDFLKHPFMMNDYSTISKAFEDWDRLSNKMYDQLKQNEEELNRIFIETYGLQNELTPEVESKDVTIQKADLERDIKSFISYAVGCSFGRYSLDEDGLIYAGGEFDYSKYKTFKVDKDNILPILPGAYFKDDIVSRFINFVRITFGEETLIDNLDFVANGLGRKKTETAKETLNRYFLNDFYKDHIKTYSKRPIYWLFTSGKEKAFNCLIYMHRYDKTTLSRIRTDYLHDYQIRLDAEKKDLLSIIDGDSTAKEISNAKKELKSLEKKIDELKAYDELLHHMADMQIEIDLDDGVKVNYEKFKGLLAPIK